MVVNFHHKFKATVPDMCMIEFILKRKTFYVVKKQAQEVQTGTYQLFFWKTDKNTIVRTVKPTFEEDTHVWGNCTGKIFVLKGHYDTMTLGEAENHYHFCYKYTVSIKIENNSCILYIVRMFDLRFSRITEQSIIDACCFTFCSGNMLTNIKNDINKDETEIVEAIKKMSPISKFCVCGVQIPLLLDERVCRKCHNIENKYVSGEEGI